MDHSEITYVAVTSAGYWGKGATIAEALRNAEVFTTLDCTVTTLVIIGADPKDKEAAFVDDWGSVCYPPDAECINAGRFDIRALLHPRSVLDYAAELLDDMGRTLMADRLRELVDSNEMDEWVERKEQEQEKRMKELQEGWKA